MRTDIVEYLENELKTRCERESNFFGMGIYFHIKAVVNNAVFLANRFGADTEVVTIAAWLHDIAAVTDYKMYEEHHIHGAKIAEEILNDFNYDKEKTEIVKKCILHHRGSKPAEKSTAEEICVADADAISHFDSIPSLLYLAFVKKNLNISDGTDFVINKLKRSYSKLSDDGKAVYKEKYENAVELLSQKYM